MKNYMKTWKKWLSIVLTFLLVVGNGAFAGSVVAESSELNPGGVRVDKHRSTYELSPGDSTDITLSVDTIGEDTTSKIDVVITIDISNSMVNNNDGSSTVMALTQAAAKSLANQLLSPNNGSRVALVRYGDFASVYDFTNGTWIKLDDSTTSASLIGDNLYTSNLTAVNNRIDAIRSGRNSGWIRSQDWWGNWYWDWSEDLGGTTTEAGLVLTRLVALEATQTSYAVFMSDGVPTSRMIAQNMNSDGRYGITRDGDGTATSNDEKSESLDEANALRSLTGTGVFSIAITLGLSDVEEDDSYDIMSAAASEPSMYYATNTPSTDIDNIYVDIGGTIIDKIAKNAVVTDIVPEYFDVLSLGDDMIETDLGGGRTQITWTIGNLMAGNTTNQYTLTLREGYYGIIDTNESAVLTYTDHYMGASDPNSLADRTFPIPEIKAQPTANDDEYTTPDNVNPYIIPDTILDNDINAKIDDDPYDDRSGTDYTPLADRNVQDYEIVIVDPLGTGEGEITNFNYDTGTFTYLPNSSRPNDPGETTYTVDFTYKLVSKDAAGAYVSNIATVTIIVPYGATGSFTPAVTKDLDGRDLAADEFTFDLKEGATVLQTVKNLANGTIPFTAINYTLADVGTHTYKITEKTSGLGGVTDDGLEVTYVVTVSDNGDGTLDVDYDTPTDTKFNNVYAATGSFTPAVTKDLDGRDLAADEFTFDLKEGATVLQTVKNLANGTIPFTAINYTLADVGTHTYKITEKTSGLGGVTDDGLEVTYVVTVSDNGDGTLDVDYDTPTDTKFNNVYAATGSFTPAVTKDLDGRDLAADEFTFDLKEGATVLQTVKNLANGTIPFTAINYTLADVGTHTYKITEKTSGLGGVTDDGLEVTYVVTVSDNGDGTLDVDYDTPTDTKFNNVYAATGSFTPAVTKDLDGRDLAADEFTFDLKEGATVLQTVKNLANGTIPFTAINYTLADVGTHTYKITEKTSGLGGVTDDGLEVTYVVTVSDKGDGTLDVDYDTPTDTKFNNVYAATGSFTPAVTKDLDGRDLAADEFTFDLKEGATVLQTVKNLANGTIPFTAINYTLADVGTHTYKITEKTSGLGGVTDDGLEVTYVVTVSDNGDGTLDVDYDTPTDTKFNNVYAATGSFTPAVTKDLDGRDLAADEFTFDLKEGATVLQTVKNLANGTIPFTAINYTLADVGTHTYKITEKTSGLGGVTDDGLEVTYVVTVSDNGDGTLDVDYDTPTDTKFNNVYAATGSFTPAVTKDLDGRDLAADEFTFDLKEGATVLQTVKNLANGTIPFTAINYTLADVGTHTYKITEKTSGLGGVTDDGLEVTYVVTVSDKGDGTLDVDYDTPTDTEFNNVYAATGSLDLSGMKTLDGRDLEVGEFEFELYEGATLLETVSNLADGSFSFATLNYTLADVGSKTYTIIEAAGSQGEIIYDTTVYTVEVDISDNGDGTLDVSLAEASDDPESLNFTNVLKTYYIELLKIDGRDEETPLSGAVFELRSAIGTETLIPGELLETLTTNSEGIALTAAAYAPGNYFLVEATAPLGFHPIMLPIQVVISNEAEDGSTVTVTITNDFINDPSLTISKQVANVTLGGVAADLAIGTVGETVQYTVVVTNDGNAVLTDVYLTDDEALIGSAVEVDGAATTWIAGPGGLAMVELGDMAPGDAITIEYTYDLVSEDLAREPIINTATANGTMLPTPDYPDGVTLEVSDIAIVTVEDVPLGVAAIELTKRVQNVTRGGIPADLAGGQPGDMFRYTLVITNTGEADLSDVILTDDQVIAGGTVKHVTAGTTLAWLADGSNPAYLELGDLASGESIVLTYEYTSLASDAEEIRINTAHVIATVTATLGSEAPVTLEDEDTASIAVDSIPQTGEQGNSLPMAGLALITAAGVLMILRRRNRKSETQ